MDLVDDFDCYENNAPLSLFWITLRENNLKKKIELGYIAVLVLREIITSLNFVSLSCSGEVTVSTTCICLKQSYLPVV